MDEEEFENFWRLQAESNQLIGKLQSLLSRIELDGEQLDDVTVILKDAQETVAIGKRHIREATFD